VALEHLVSHAVYVVRFGQIAGVDMSRASAPFNPLSGLLKLGFGASDQQNSSTGSADLECSALSDPRGGAGDHHDAAIHSVLERLRQ
jgi:hypothetical protein